MPSPLPGMDPYLENEGLWPDFHHRLVCRLLEDLVRQLTSRYEAAVRQRSYSLPEARNDEQRAEEYIEIRERTGGKLISVLDVVSPANKLFPAGRRAYLDTRRQASNDGANLIEIDLILQGSPTLEYSRDGLPHWDYAATVTRASQPKRFEIYTATLQRRLPRFRLPLASDDRDTVIDLNTAFVRCYDDGGFGARIDYTREPPASLTDENRRWLDETLVAEGLREPAPSDEHIRVAAYYLWEQEGRPDGRDRDHWHAARASLRPRGTRRA